jgi:hypothetical protein
MNVERIEQELPRDLVRWLRSADPECWEPVAREIALRTAVALLDDDGAAGWDDELRERLDGTAVKAIARELPRGRRWNRTTVVGPVCDYFGLFGEGYRRWVYDRVSGRIAQSMRTGLAKSA